MTELAKVENGGAIQPVSAAQAVQEMMLRGITADSVDALDHMMQLQEREQARIAKQSWGLAFAKVKAKTKTINATRANPDKNGNVRWWMADLVDLQNEIEPICESEGLVLSFDTRRDGPTLGIMTGICIVKHIATGYEERREFGVTANGAQGGDAGAGTTACRRALIAMFALRIRHDDDARMLGDMCNIEQAATIFRRVKALRFDDARMRKFLAHAGVTVDPDKPIDESHWKSIRQGSLRELHKSLSDLEKKEAGATANNPAKQTPAPAGTAAGAITSAPAAPEVKAAVAAVSIPADEQAAITWVEAIPTDKLASEVLKFRPKFNVPLDMELKKMGMSSAIGANEVQLRQLATIGKLAMIRSEKIAQK